ncbi:MAG: hypothetical protein ACTTH5_07510 [Wolinella sp.]
MLELISSTVRNIGLGIFVNGAFALQFTEAGERAYGAIFEGIVVMLLAGYAELRTRRKDG